MRSRVQVRELLEPVDRARRARQRRASSSKCPTTSPAGACSCSRLTPTDRLGLGAGELQGQSCPPRFGPSMPNQVTEGDRFDAAFSVMNRTDAARDIRVDDRGRRRRACARRSTSRRCISSPTRARRCKCRVDRGARCASTAIVPTGRIAFHGDGARRRRRRRPAPRARRAQAPLARDGRELRLVRRRTRDGVACGFPSASIPTWATSASCCQPTRHRQRRRRVPLSARLSVRVLGATADEGRDGVALHAPARLLAARISNGPAGATLADETLAQAANFQAPSGGMAYYWPQDEAT